jgi:uncharacterized membrane protein YdjX (TVP38/TMEM64 family)
MISNHSRTSSPFSFFAYISKARARIDRASFIRFVMGILVVGLLGGIYLILKETGARDAICSCDTVQGYITSLGFYGPLAVIGLMLTAVVLSPIPSAPIALAAGMAYGHTWGTIYIVIGAELGAIVAFTISRVFGYEILHRWFGNQISIGVLKSQRFLTLVVFAGRLLPFISFDVLSYAAGLTSLKFWRFALATLAGIIPISFLLAHFGRELRSTDMYSITLTVLALGTITLIPIIVKTIQAHRKQKTRKSLSWISDIPSR